MRQITFAILLFYFFVPPHQTHADLFWDGAPTSAGEKFANASQLYTLALANFMFALSEWEGRTNNDGSVISDQERKTRSQKAYFLFVTQLSEVKENLSELLRSDDLSVSVNLTDDTVQSLSELNGPATLEEMGHPQPANLFDVVNISLQDVERIYSIAISRDWTNEVQNNRQIILQLSDEISKSLKIGVIISVYSSSVGQN